MSVTQLERPAPPNLPLAPGQYDSRYQDQLNSVSRLYYNRLNELLNNILIDDGGRYIGFPFGSFYDVTDQTAASTTTAYAMKLQSTAASNDIEIIDNTKITVRKYGVYNIQFSAQFVNTDSQIQDVDVWFKKNNSNVADSNSRFSIMERHGSVDGHLIAALNFFVDLDPDDYIEIMWCTTNTGASIQHLATAATPDRPATPSVIATVAFVSRPV